MKFSIKYVFCKCDQIRSFLWIWSHLLKKSLMENFIFLSSADLNWLSEYSASPSNSAITWLQNPLFPAGQDQLPSMTLLVIVLSFTTTERFSFFILALQSLLTQSILLLLFVKILSEVKQCSFFNSRPLSKVIMIAGSGILPLNYLCCSISFIVMLIEVAFPEIFRKMFPY